LLLDSHVLAQRLHSEGNMNMMDRIRQFRSGRNHAARASGRSRRCSPPDGGAMGSAAVSSRAAPSLGRAWSSNRGTSGRGL